jgi:dihydrofolate reductase
MAPSTRRVTYGVAASLDGYIAGPNGEADWIPMDPDIDFKAMWAKFDTLLIGRKTFATMARPGKKYKGMAGITTVVFSTSLRAENYPGVRLVREGAERVVTELKAAPGKDIWLFGGGELFRSLAALGLVDAVSVAVVPVMLGGGIPLFPGPAARLPLKLLSQRTYEKSGIVSMEYAALR